MIRSIEQPMALAAFTKSSDLSATTSPSRARYSATHSAQHEHDIVYACPSTAMTPITRIRNGKRKTLYQSHHDGVYRPP